MDKRIRSPNYPSVGLREAVERVANVFERQNRHGADREVVARSLGYTSLNGASATTISALVKYGLLEGRAEDIRVSDRALQILHSETPSERITALRAAAMEPALFRELSEKFPGRLPTDDVFRSYLIRRGFAPNAVPSVIAAYRETSEFVEHESGSYDSPEFNIQDDKTMESQAVQHNLRASGVSSTPTVGQPALAAVQPEDGKFKVSMGDDFRVDIVANKLDRSAVNRLKRWLEANMDLVPDGTEGEG